MQMNADEDALTCVHPRSSAVSTISVTYRLRRSRRALRFLLPTLRRRRGLAMGNAPFKSLSVVRAFFRNSRRVAYRGKESASSRRGARIALAFHMAR